MLEIIINYLEQIQDPHPETDRKVRFTNAFLGNLDFSNKDDKVAIFCSKDIIANFIHNNSGVFSDSLIVDSDLSFEDTVSVISLKKCSLYNTKGFFQKLADSKFYHCMVELNAGASNCYFENCEIRDGGRYTNCTFKDCVIGNVNLINCKTENSQTDNAKEISAKREKRYYNIKRV